MPRVLHLFNIFGALTERAMLDCTLGLSRAGFDLTIGHETCAPEAPSCDLRRVALKRIEVDPTPDVPAQMRRLATDMADPAMLALLDEPFDLIHGHFGPRILQAAPWLQRGTPMIVSLYGYDVGRLLRDPCWIERYRWAADHGATFVSLSRCMEEKLLALGLPRDRVRRIHLGIDLARHPFTPRPAPATPRFVFIGRFVEKKGTRDLIDAFAHLMHAAQISPILDLIGTGPNEPALRQQVADRGLTRNVNFLGALPFSQLFDHLRECTALVQPSVTASDGDAEGAPMVLMSAQAVGVPCITTRHSGNPETMPPVAEGFIVPEADPLSLSSAMQAMIKQHDDARTTLQLAGRKWIESCFDLQQTIAEYAALYRKLIATSAS